jgi:hypothetical protein
MERKESRASVAYEYEYPASAPMPKIFAISSVPEMPPLTVFVVVLRAGLVSLASRRQVGLGRAVSRRIGGCLGQVAFFVGERSTAVAAHGDEITVREHLGLDSVVLLLDTGACWAIPGALWQSVHGQAEESGTEEELHVC